MTDVINVVLLTLFSILVIFGGWAYLGKLRKETKNFRRQLQTLSQLVLIIESQIQAQATLQRNIAEMGENIEDMRIVLKYAEDVVSELEDSINK